ncbi:hypothetical protein BS50DRAFT_654893 [Corynespora cassiicola Philippines]|uniref:Uncharacterized protein n=1 Tax=Corynespora cassiicola Philippines TaxID=1448308 RepID=A0A2T2N513_CORCC|nr:hypothetical protein BS50DRAFT_654893 [Corynespora cassiicola Philippines]
MSATFESDLYALLNNPTYSWLADDNMIPQCASIDQKLARSSPLGTPSASNETERTPSPKVGLSNTQPNSLKRRPSSTSINAEKRFKISPNIVVDKYQECASTPIREKAADNTNESQSSILEGSWLDSKEPIDGGKCFDITTNDIFKFDGGELEGMENWTFGSELYLQLSDGLPQDEPSEDMIAASDHQSPLSVDYTSIRSGPPTAAPIEAVSPMGAGSSGETISPIEALSSVEAVSSAEEVLSMEADANKKNTAEKVETQSSQDYGISEGTGVQTLQIGTKSTGPNKESSIIILDNNEGKSILIEDSDEEAHNYNSRSKKKARRSQPPKRPLGIIDWTLESHKEERKNMVWIEWKNVEEQWIEIYKGEALYKFKRLWGFQKKINKAGCHFQEHNDLSPGKAEKLCIRWQKLEPRLLKKALTEPEQENLREFGRRLARLREVEAERQSGEIPMDDGDENDDDYTPNH